MATKKAMWRQGDPASMMQGGKRVPVAVLGFVESSGDDGEIDVGEQKVRIRLTDGSEKAVHPNVLLAPGQVKQYRQRKARVEKGGVAAEANRMAREGYRLIALLGEPEEKEVEKPGRESWDHDTETVHLATLLFERDVPSEIERVTVTPPPPPPQDEEAMPQAADDDDSAVEEAVKSSLDEPEGREQDRAREEFVGDEPEDRDGPHAA